MMVDVERYRNVVYGLSEILVFCHEEFGKSDHEMQAKLTRINSTAKDALELLKAQEPRVMTATEAYTADYVYIEFDGVITPAIRTTNERDGHRESYFATQQLGGDWMRWDDYGITWRCWTSRPTDEQREAVKWNVE